MGYYRGIQYGALTIAGVCNTVQTSTRRGCQLPRPCVRTLCKICAAFYAGKVSPYAATGSTMFFMLKAFGAGVILATGFIHMWPDANESFSNSCLGEQSLLIHLDLRTGLFLVRGTQRRLASS